MIQKLKIGHLADKNVNSLSLGQKQLVAIAGVLAMSPKYIVFDEPTTMLDSRNKKIVLNRMNSLNRSFGIGIILVTNDPADLKYARDVAVLKEVTHLVDIDGEHRRHPDAARA